MHATGKIFVKTYVEANRDTFFPNMWNFPIYFYLTEGQSLNFYTYRETLSSPGPSFSETSWSTIEENPENGWSVYCNNFLSKQKIYSM